jgi:hypothetical protein
VRREGVRRRRLQEAEARVEAAADGGVRRGVEALMPLAYVVRGVARAREQRRQHGVAERRALNGTELGVRWHRSAAPRALVL